MRKRIRPLLTFLLGWPFSIVAIAFLAKSFISRASGLTFDLGHIHLSFIFLGILAFIGYYFLRSYIWYKLLVFQGNSLDLSESLFNWSFAQLKRYIPGNIWGVVGVSLHFSQKNVSKKDLSSSFVTESVLVVLSASFLSLLALPIIIPTLHLEHFSGFINSIGILLLALVTLGYFFSGYITRINKLPAIFTYALAPFHYQKLIVLWSMMTVSFIFYGLGTYFIASSVAYIDPHNIWTFIGYFVFSLLLGFVSLITPTGLGVREGAIALGLSTVMKEPLAAFISLFARFVLIIAELFFIAISSIINRTKKSFVTKAVKTIQSNPHLTILLLSYLIFVLYFSFISVMRYENFYAGRFDLGNMEQTIWNTVNGNIFQLSNPNGTNIVSRLSFHADFILILLAPLYFFWQDPKMLLILQTLITGCGSFFIYLLGKDMLKNKTVATIFALLYLLNPSLQRSVIYDFHAVTLATTFLLAAFYFIRKKKYVWFIIFSLLAAITKEQIWAILALFGGYIFFVQKKRLLGSIFFIVSSLIFYSLIWEIIPHAAGAQHFALSYYSNGEVAASPTSLIRSFFFDPIKIINIVLDPGRVNYLVQLFSPLGYLAIFSPLFLIFAGPDLVINILSSKSELYQIYYQYTAAITPFIFISSLAGAAVILKRVRFVTPFALCIYLVVTGIYTAYLYSPLPGSKSPNLDMITKINSNRDHIDQVLRAIPSQYSVATSNSLGSHITHRKYLYTIPYGWDDADYVIFLTNETNAFPSLADHLNQINKLSTNSAYVKYYDDQILVAFRKKGIDAPIKN